MILIFFPFSCFRSVVPEQIFMVVRIYVGKKRSEAEVKNCDLIIINDRILEKKETLKIRLKKKNYIWQ